MSSQDSKPRISYRELKAEERRARTAVSQEWKNKRERDKERRLQVLDDLDNGTPLYCPGCGRPLVQLDSQKEKGNCLYDCENPDCFVYEVKRKTYRTRSSFDKLTINFKVAAAL